VLGNNPDIARLQQCAKAWLLKGWRIGNLTWVTEWYKDGMPVSEHKQNHSNQPTPETASTQPTQRKHFPTDEELAAMPRNQQRWYEYNRKYFLDPESPTMQAPVNRYTN